MVCKYEQPERELSARISQPLGRGSSLNLDGPVAQPRAISLRADRRSLPERRLRGVMSKYEIQLFNADGTLSVTMPTDATSLAEAVELARPLLIDTITFAEIWSDLARIATVRRQLN